VLKGKDAPSPAPGSTRRSAVQGRPATAHRTAEKLVSQARSGLALSTGRSAALIRIDGRDRVHEPARGGHGVRIEKDRLRRAGVKRGPAGERSPSRCPGGVSEVEPGRPGPRRAARRKGKVRRDRSTGAAGSAGRRMPEDRGTRTSATAAIWTHNPGRRRSSAHPVRGGVAQARPRNVMTTSARAAAQPKTGASAAAAAPHRTTRSSTDEQQDNQPGRCRGDGRPPPPGDPDSDSGPRGPEDSTRRKGLLGW